MGPRWTIGSDPEWTAARDESHALTAELTAASAANFTVGELYEIMGIGDRFQHAHHSPDWIRRRDGLKAIKEAAAARRR